MRRTLSKVAFDVLMGAPVDAHVGGVAPRLTPELGAELYGRGSDVHMIAVDMARNPPEPIEVHEPAAEQRADLVTAAYIVMLDGEAVGTWVVDEPASWDYAMREFIRNESSWCSNNARREGYLSLREGVSIPWDRDDGGVCRVCDRLSFEPQPRSGRVPPVVGHTSPLKLEVVFPGGSVDCCTCDNTITESLAKSAGWAYATGPTGDPAWQCADCLMGEGVGRRVGGEGLLMRSRARAVMR